MSVLRTLNEAKMVDWFDTRLNAIENRLDITEVPERPEPEAAAKIAVEGEDGDEATAVDTTDDIIVASVELITEQERYGKKTSVSHGSVSVIIRPKLSDVV